MGARAGNHCRLATGISPPTEGRSVALEIFRRVRAGDLADRAMEAAARGLPQRDRQWTHELVYGALRLRGRMDHLLAQRVRGGLDHLEADVLDVLRLGAYQLLEMGSVPAYAAISQSVELTRAAGAPRAAGLVSGVLHALSRSDLGSAFPDAERQPLEHMVAWGSHPPWLVERWSDRWGVESARRLVEANNRRPELYILPLGSASGSAHERLRARGIETAEVAIAPGGLKLLPPATARDALASVGAVVQDPAAQLVTRYAAVPEGAGVLDLCAAPGGKALALAQRAQFVVAADLSLGRLRRVRDNVQRLGAEKRVGIVAADARHAPFATADLVLLDVPCTGTGTLRRHPDARWRITPEDLGALAVLQAEILEGAARHVRPGGWLVYATCALEPEENELQIERFLDMHPEFESDPVPDAVDSSLLSDRGWLHVLPQNTGTDGAFAARLRKRG
ncbi:16S rRNA (cytosine(967)-C(5))-methyltransferase RsmB [soil metagenome]